MKPSQLVQPTASYGSSYQYNFLLDKCKSISDIITGDILTNVIELVQQLNSIISEQKHYQIAVEKWLARCLPFENEKEIYEFVKEFKISSTIEHNMLTKLNSSKWNNIRKKGNQNVFTPKVQLTRSVTDSLEKQRMGSNINFSDESPQLPNETYVPSRSADNCIEPQKEVSLQLNAKSFVPKRKKQQIEFENADVVADFLGEEVINEPTKTEPKEEQQTKQVAIKYSFGSKSFVPRNKVNVPQSSRSPSSFNFYSKKFIPTTKRKQMIIQPDSVAQEFINSHINELKEVLHCDQMNLIYNGTNFVGLEKIIDLEDIVIVFITENDSFGFQMNGSKKITPFILQNPFDLIPVRFDPKVEMNFNIELNIKHEIMEVWHFIRLTGTTAFISDDFNEFYNDPTEIGSDVFTGSHQPDTFKVSHFLAFSTI
ncbi:hypothetical protein EDI_158560 [Entamoeba dispar SAW760]|uniref:Uncharacterized protein n=1 Tax=Entamoeba dispar (strain ATCC PRA-260 / SAW760) TaxID=370354 RepID=B0E9S1_ENTDS|nr:uncharacterized protein EDI_158560 [Entamoeba dispar SAW760]EDR28718.1 hypothetical protein EDI_158560 [Entamoeba dispar SAW760]|eukprot:EDR28718.1 hypothetical protein EDI_158560 [Entamoeba dispar SAW760]